MAARLEIVPEAEWDLDEAYTWHERQRSDWVTSSWIVLTLISMRFAERLESMRRSIRDTAGYSSRGFLTSSSMSTMNGRISSRSTASSIPRGISKPGGDVFRDHRID